MPEALFAIRPRVRRAVLGLLSSLHIDVERMVREVGSRRAFATVGELFDYLGDVFGLTQQRCETLYFDALGVPGSPSNVGLRRDVALTSSANTVLVAMSDALFIEAVQLGVEQSARDGARFGWSGDYVRDV